MGAAAAPLDQPYVNPGHQNIHPATRPCLPRPPVAPGSCRTRTARTIRPTSHARNRSSRPPRQLPRRRRPPWVSARGNSPELDQQYSDGKIAMEEYMARRDEIMNG